MRYQNSLSHEFYSVFGFMKVNTVYEHEYYAKVKGKEKQLHWGDGNRPVTLCK